MSDVMTTPVPMPVLQRAATHGDEVMVLVHEAFAMGLQAGRREGYRECKTEAIDLCHDLVDRTEHGHDDLDENGIKQFEIVFANAKPSGYVAAYYAATSDILCIAIEALRKLRSKR